ncbi:hypothetical protein [Fulvivirga ligni]|uniref:hypothetical protein n=1 Tax=Fulvivirga ligni TaxID=2904246 RepID=UPI001F3BA9CC|nr:hypothetical protein [Fulvivirga ligni]UII21696.1 hypothetical protein LVD16_00395 [Fulvivirga ligni]
MKKIHLFLFSLIPLICYSQTDSQNKNNQDQIFLKINKTLFENFVNGNFGPYETKNEQGYYILNTQSYFSYLNRLDIFSQEFYQKEKERLRECQQDLEELKWTGITDLGWEPRSCSFFNYMYWLKSQESPHAYEVSELSIKSNSAQSRLRFYDNYNNEKSYWHESLLIKYRKFDDIWRIIEISEE